jgi:hypothetical protein
MLSRLLRLVLIPPLLLGMTALVIIGLKDLDLLAAIIPKLIVAVVLISIPILILRRLLFPVNNKRKGG